MLMYCTYTLSCCRKPWKHSWSSCLSPSSCTCSRRTPDPSHVTDTPTLLETERWRTRTTEHLLQLQSRFLGFLANAESLRLVWRPSIHTFLCDRFSSFGGFFVQHISCFFHRPSSAITNFVYIIIFVIILSSLLCFSLQSQFSLGMDGIVRRWQFMVRVGAFYQCHLVSFSVRDVHS